MLNPSSTTKLSIDSQRSHLSEDTAGFISNPLQPAAPAAGRLTAKQHPSPSAVGATIATSHSLGQAPPPAVPNTLDEPISATLKRDLLNIWRKLSVVLVPRGNREILRDWDLWGPLLLCLSLAVMLSVRAPEEQTALVFSGAFFIIWCGAAVVTLNAKLLGGKLSFFQSVCVLGYCIFPLVIAAIVCMFVPIVWIRAILVSVSFAWSTFAAIGFLSDQDSGLANRRALALFPICLFYFTLGWMILITKSAV